MKFTLSWLKDFLDTSATLEEITTKLGELGHEIEEVVDKAKGLQDFKIARILEAKPHPEADKLQICQVDTGQEILQIVCGAPNARAGLKVVLAPIGSIIPTSAMKIKQSKIRNVESCGMLCSASELGIGGDSAGIIEMPAETEIGSKLVDVLQLNDQLIDVAITPNRGDCLGVIGLARELAAGGLGTLKDIKVPTITTDFDSKLKVQVEDDNICPHFVGYHIKDVTNRPSPDWLQNRLKMIGLTPISAIVDITNYICFSYSRPLHAYDAGKLSGNLKVRVTNSEKLTLLNDKEYQLSGEEIVVADETKPLGLAGIMGSLDAACDMETKEVLLEAAVFNPLLIAKAGRKHSLQSDARYRFERQVDPGFTEAGLAIAVKMITDICGGKISQIITGSKQESKPQIIHFRLAKIKELGGTDLAAGKAVEILKSLGFAVQPAGEILQLTVPSWRNDIEGEADIVEEVIRVNGYQHLIEEPLPGALDLPTTSLTRPQKNLMTLRRLLASRGLNEVVSWSFMSSKKAELFGPLHEEMTLQNPINRELDYMRPSIIGNMLGIIRKNHTRSLRNLSCFEIGPIFAPAGQELVITGIREGKTAGKSIYPEQRNFDVYDIKADFIAVLNEIGLNFERFESSANVPSWYHPKRASAVQLGKNIVGYFGELHPSIIQQFGVKSNVVAFEILIGNLPQQKSKSTSKGVYEVSDYPKVERDYAFVLDQGVTAAALLKAVKDCEKNLITKVELFDVYESDSLGDNKKSLALTVTFQAKDRTLTDGEIEIISHKIIANVKEKLGGELRAS